ncbi:MAG: endonuclease/exonuclease/phosphatase family protein [Gammaproteobacteria bacterium]
MSKNPPLSTKLPKEFRIATYNINFGETYKITAPQKTLKAIKAINADVILLQENTSAWSSYFKMHLKDLYGYQYFKPYHNGGGMGFLSKYPLTTEWYGHSHIGWDPAWIVSVNTNIGKLQILNVHLTPPLITPTNVGFLFRGGFITPDIRYREMQFYKHQLKPHMSTIIAGDFNEGNSGKAVKYLQSQGFKDAIVRGNIRGCTWTWYIGLLKLCNLYDHIFYTQALELHDVNVLRAGDSDHYPASADFVAKHKQTN